MFSTGGAAICTPCATGRFGNTTALTQPSCSGNCSAGSYGDRTMLTTPTCRGNCSAGYYCPAGSVSPTQAVCPVGRYSLGGAGLCPGCPMGRYGNVTGLSTAQCSGLCPAGRYGATPGVVSNVCEGDCRCGVTVCWTEWSRLEQRLGRRCCEFTVQVCPVRLPRVCAVLGTRVRLDRPIPPQSCAQPASSRTLDRESARCAPRVASVPMTRQRAACLVSKGSMEPARV